MSQRPYRCQRWLALIMAVCLLLPSSFVRSNDFLENYRFITEDYPPFNYLDDGRLTGISVDLLDRIFAKLGSDRRRSSVTVHPWARGYRMALTVPGTVLFVMTRNPQRENLFRWVGPVASSPIVLMARKDRHIVINHLEDLNHFHIVSIGSDIGEFVLDDYQIPRTVRQSVPYPDIAAKMLISGRTDLWAYGDLAALWILKQQGGKPEDFEAAWDFGSAGDNYYAFHRDTPDEVIEAFQQALDSLKAERNPDGSSVYETILNSYIR